MGKLETRPRLVRRWLEFTSDWFRALSRTFQPIAKNNNVNCDLASSPDPPPAYSPELLVRAATRFRGRFSKVPIAFRARKAVLGLPCLHLGVLKMKQWNNHSVNEAKMTGFWATNCGTIQLVLISKLDLPLHPKSYLAVRETGTWGP